MGFDGGRVSPRSGQALVGTMRILHVGVGNLGPGGVSTYVDGLAQAQRLRGHDVSLAELWPTGGEGRPKGTLPLDGFDEVIRLRDEQGADVVHLHALVPSYEGLGGRAVMTSHEHAAHCASGGRYLEGRRKTCTREFGWLGCLAGHYLDGCGSRHPRNVLRRFQVTQAATEFQGHWIAPSAFSHGQIVRRGIPRAKVHHVPNPVGPLSEDLPVRAEGKHDFLYLGRLVPNKGCDVLLRAMERLPGRTLLVLGEGPERSALESLAMSLGLGDRVDFGGWASPDRVGAMLRQSRALVVPSLWPEPFGLVALEAYRESCPVVASRVGGLADLVEDGQTGFLVPPDDPSSLAEAMGKLLLPELAEAMGARGRRMAGERFAMSSHLAALDEIYAAARGAT